MVLIMVILLDMIFLENLMLQRFFLKSAPVENGIIVGGPTRSILELIGFKNIISKVYNSRTSINVILAIQNDIWKLKIIKVFK